MEQVTPEIGLIALCDGMGGAKAGGVASSLAIETFRKSLEEQVKKSDDHSRSLLKAVSEANEAVCHRAQVDADCTGMGTTLVAALADGENCYVANVGDSRAYRISKDGIRLVTRDHSLVEDLVERGEITEQQARSHPQKNLLTRALGAGSGMKPDLFMEAYKEGDFILLCSDGLSNVLADQELLYEVIHGGEPETCCDRLIEIVLTRGSPDNITAVLLQM